MPEHDLLSHAQNASREMQGEYDRIQKRTQEDPGTAGDNGEENWAELLRRWLPRYMPVVTKGRIINVRGEGGPQVDVLVLSPAYPKALEGKKEYMESGVLAAFECKLTLDAQDIRKAVENAARIRRQESYKSAATAFEDLHSHVLYGLLAHAHSWTGERSTPIANIARILNEHEWKVADRPREVLDLICVANLAAWNTQRHISVGSAFHRQRPPHIPAPMWDSWCEADGMAQVNHYCQTDPVGAQLDVFTPIGFFLTGLMERLAWKDPNLRPLVCEFQSIGLSKQRERIPSSAAGKMWPASVLAQRVRAVLGHPNYKYPTLRWDEWDSMF